MSRGTLSAAMPQEPRLIAATSFSVNSRVSLVSSFVATMIEIQRPALVLAAPHQIGCHAGFGPRAAAEAGSLFSIGLLSEKLREAGSVGRRRLVAFGLGTRWKPFCPFHELKVTMLDRTGDTTTGQDSRRAAEGVGGFADARTAVLAAKFTLVERRIGMKRQCWVNRMPGAGMGLSSTPLGDDRVLFTPNFSLRSLTSRLEAQRRDDPLRHSGFSTFPPLSTLLPACSICQN